MCPYTDRLHRINSFNMSRKGTGGGGGPFKGHFDFEHNRYDCGGRRDGPPGEGHILAWLSPWKCSR